MKILVTGGAGFIGSTLVDNLIKKGHEVVIIDDLSSGREENINPKAKFYHLDIANRKISEVFEIEKPEAIFHLAAQIDARGSVRDPFFDAKINILGFLNVLQNVLYYGNQWSKMPKFIFSSTGGALYGETKKIPTTETHEIVSESPYGLTKRTTEEYLKLYNKVADLDFVALRYSNVYGPRQDGSKESGVISIFINRVLEAEPFIINGKGRITRDFVYVDDVVKANLLALKKSTKKWTLKNRFLNVGTGREINMTQLAKMIQKIAGTELSIIYGPPKTGDIKRSALSYAKIKRLLGWVPKHSLEKGIEKTLKSNQ